MNITGVGGCYTHESVPMGRMRKQSYWTRSVLLSKKVAGTIRMKKEMLKNTLRRDAIGGGRRRSTAENRVAIATGRRTVRLQRPGIVRQGGRRRARAFCRCGGIHCRSAIDECVDDPGLSEGSSPSSGSQSLFFLFLRPGKTSTRPERFGFCLVVRGESRFRRKPLGADVSFRRLRNSNNNNN